MNDLQNIRTEWNLNERIAFFVREFHPEVYEGALDAIVKQEIEKRIQNKTTNKGYDKK